MVSLLVLKLKLPLNKSNVQLLETLEVKVNIDFGKDDTVMIPVGNRRSLKAGDLTKEQLISAFTKQNFRLI